MRTLDQKKIEHHLGKRREILKREKAYEGTKSPTEDIQVDEQHPKAKKPKTLKPDQPQEEY